jgi:hypothetical protein
MLIEENLYEDDRDEWGVIFSFTISNTLYDAEFLYASISRMMSNKDQVLFSGFKPYPFR